MKISYFFEKNGLLFTLSLFFLSHLFFAILTREYHYTLKMSNNISGVELAAIRSATVLFWIGVVICFYWIRRFELHSSRFIPVFLLFFILLGQFSFAFADSGILPFFSVLGTATTYSTIIALLVLPIQSVGWLLAAALFIFFLNILVDIFIYLAFITGGGPIM